MVANVEELVIASEGPPLSKEELDELIVRAQQKLAEKYAALKHERRESRWPTWSTAVNSAKRFLNALRLLVVLVSFHVMLAWVLCRYYAQYQRCAGDPSPFASVMTCFFFRLED
ncbi:unnamed protein product [Ectocarpus sp. CCAP 1310/34]|nr:unnamed protein product [Ectocarpus sp. CCAP 1310/34]